MADLIDISGNFALKYNPTDILVFYSAAVDEHRQNAYVEHHEIKDGKVLAGKPAPRKVIEQLSVAAAEDTPSTATIRNIVPENLLFHDSRPGRHIVAWWEPAQIRTLKFAPKQGYKESYKIPLPALFFCGNSDKLNVWALSRSERPSLKTLIYRAPLCNVFSTGEICLGNIKSPGEEDVADLVRAWSHKFWNGLFTSHGNDNKKLYATINGRTAFPTLKELKPGEKYKSINDVLESL